MKTFLPTAAMVAGIVLMFGAAGALESGAFSLARSVVQASLGCAVSAAALWLIEFKPSRDTQEREREKGDNQKCG
jgi:hypothetical protein